MIPINIQYSQNFERSFLREVGWFKEFLDKYSGSDSKAKQLLLLSTEEYHSYLNFIDNMSHEIIEAYGGTCTYCDSSDIASVLPLHPLNQNRNFTRLATELRNIVPFCSQCRKLLTIFKYSNPGTLANPSFDKLMLKNPNILIPIQQPTHLKIKYSIEQGLFFGQCDASRRTIKISGINEASRVNNRKNSHAKLGLPLKITEGSISDNYEELWTVLKPNRDYFRKDFNFANNLINLKGTYSDFIQTSLPNRILHDSRNNIREVQRDIPIDLKALNFSGLRTIQDGKVNLSRIKSLGIIGENGVGKSTLINFFSVAVRGTRKHKIQHSSDGYINQNLYNASCTLYGEKNSYPFENQVETVKVSDNLFHCDAHIDGKMRVAYINELRVQDPLIKSAELWLNSLFETKFNEVASQLKQMLDIDYDSSLVRVNGSVKVRVPGVTDKSLSTLSSGYKSILGIIYNIYRQFGDTYELSSEYMKTDSIVGVVFIDEIDLHLHPTWKLNIVRRFKRVFPDILFIFSTHDPLILKGCDYGEVVLLTRDKNGMTRVEQDLPDISQYDAEMILTSRYFGLGSSASSEKNDELKHYYDTIKGGNKDDILEEINKLKSLGLYGNTFREMIAFMCVDKSISAGEPINISDIVNTINQKVSSSD